MINHISTLSISEPEGISYMLDEGRFDRIDEFHVKFDVTRNVTLENVVIGSSYPFGDRVEIDSINVKLIEKVTATIVDVYGKFETRSVEEEIIDLEIPEIDENAKKNNQWIKSILIDQLNDQDRFERLIGHVSIVAN